MKLPKYALIDLSDKSVHDHPISEELFKDYMGGKILGARLLYDLQPKGLEPLAPESVLIINTGPANGSGAPSSGRFNMTFKNVLTGGIASTNCGGQFGVMLKRAGYDGIILTGKSDDPVYIEILDGSITIKDASGYMGQNTEEVQEHFDKKWGKLVIGPAGENLVRYACAVSGERVAGRCGAGAVMGSKNLKAIVAYGKQKIEVLNQDKLTKYIKKWAKFLKSHPMTGNTLPKYGTAGLVSSSNASGVLPTRNFQEGRYDKAQNISGEYFTEHLLTRNSGCISCPIRCERRVMVNDKEVKGAEYETIGLFGSNIYNDDLEWINEVNYLVDVLGMDTISLGGTIAFTMELKEKGLADFDLSFGNKDNIIEIIRKIAVRDGKYSELANGSKWLSEKYGGKDFAIHSKGLELAAYEPRNSVGMGLGYATSNRGGCHLNGGYLALLESVGILSIDKHTLKGKPELTIMFQNMLEAISAAGFCLFTSQALLPAILFKMGSLHPVTRFINRAAITARFALRPLWSMMPWIMPFNSLYLDPQAMVYKYITGQKITAGKFLQTGERGFNIERLFNLREGLSAVDDDLPARLTDIPQDAGNPDSKVRISEMIQVYYRLRGWDTDGVPTKRKLKQLRIVDL